MENMELDLGGPYNSEILDLGLHLPCEETHKGSHFLPQRGES